MTEDEVLRVGKYLAEGWDPAAYVVAGLLTRWSSGDGEQKKRVERTMQHLFDVHCTGPELAAHYELSCGGSMDAMMEDGMQAWSVNTLMRRALSDDTV